MAAAGVLTTEPLVCAVSWICFLKIQEKATDKQLCDGGSASRGALQCTNKSGGCPGSNNSNCYPNQVWSGTSSGSSYYNSYLNSGTWNAPYLIAPTYAFSVRCVLDLNCGRSATTIQVMALCSVTTIPAAARAPTITTATRVTYGQVLRQVLDIFVAT